MTGRRRPRPRLSFPYTVLTEPDTVRLVAGEDYRYALTGPGIDGWLPDLLSRLDGKHTLDGLLTSVPEDAREAAKAVVERLYGERVILDGTAQDAHPAKAYRLAVEGTGPLRDGLAELSDAGESEDEHVLRALCQDRLDYDEALRFNERCLAGESPWLWSTTGPMTRGYVSPVFLPDAGPCLACLIRRFRGISPAPEIYDALIDHSSKGRHIEPVPFPDEAARILQQLVRWKLAQLAAREPPAALYRLHVLEVPSMEVSTHRVFADPECPQCGGGG